jgi:hypothetical protein
MKTKVAHYPNPIGRLLVVRQITMKFSTSGEYRTLPIKDSLKYWSIASGLSQTRGASNGVSCRRITLNSAPLSFSSHVCIVPTLIAYPMPPNPLTTRYR